MKRSKEDDDGFQPVMPKQPRLAAAAAAGQGGTYGGGRGAGRFAGRGAGRGAGRFAGRGAGRGGGRGGPQDPHHKYTWLTNAQAAHCWDQYLCPKCYQHIPPRGGDKSEGHQQGCNVPPGRPPPADLFQRVKQR